MTNDDFTKVVEANNQRLYLIAMSFTHNHHDSEDIVQDVFIKLWKHEKPFESDEHMAKWLTVVCVNECKNFLKSASRRKNISLEEAKELYTFEEQESLDLFEQVMKLSKKESVVIQLYYYEEMTVKEIAQVLKIKESAVKARLSRARSHLKELLGDEYEQ